MLPTPLTHGLNFKPAVVNKINEIIRLSKNTKNSAAMEKTSS